MSYEWDKVKAERNEKKHGIAFPDTFGVFEDPKAITIEENVKGEERHVTIGMDGFARIPVVAYTWRNENIRIISARKATRSEVNQYESKI
jgi:uncharacterized DUF497 family protein